MNLHFTDHCMARANQRNLTVWEDPSSYILNAARLVPLFEKFYVLIEGWVFVCEKVSTDKIDIITLFKYDNDRLKQLCRKSSWIFRGK